MRIVEELIEIWLNKVCDKEYGVARVRSFTQEPQKERTCCSHSFWTVFILFEI